MSDPMFVALTSSVKALIFVLFLVLIPTVPVTIALTRAMRRSSKGPTPRDVTTGRAASTPFRLISIVGSAIAVCVFAALVIVLIAQSIGGSDKGESVAPVENGGAGAPPPTPATVPTQGNADKGRIVFKKSGCGNCHALRAAKANGTVGPSLDEDHPDFTAVVACVTTGPGDMPSFTGKLTGSEIRDVAKFVAISAVQSDTP